MFDTTAQNALTYGHNSQTGPLITVRNLSLWYGEKQALKNVSFDIFQNEALAFIGPSGCGKTTALKCLNRMHDNVRGVQIEGRIEIDGDDIHGHDVDPPVLRRRFGWVAQKPNPFVKTIYENVAYGARLHGLVQTRADLDDRVEDCLRQAHLWDEVKNDMHRKSGVELSGGQQQRLCVARALSTDPDVLLMDEPTGSIDPIATARIEELMLALKESRAVVVVTHSMMEARRVADRVAYFHLGELLEWGPTAEVFANAKNEKARDFIEGKFG